MTHEELAAHNTYGRRDKVDIHELVPGKWIVISEKPGDLAAQMFDDLAEATQAYQDIKAANAK